MPLFIFQHPWRIVSEYVIEVVQTFFSNGLSERSHPFIALIPKSESTVFVHNSCPLPTLQDRLLEQIDG